MTISHSNYRVLRLVGIGHYSPKPDEIVRESRAAFSARDPWLVAAAIHNVGHLARRFGRIDWPLVRAARAAAGRRAHLHMVQFALSDMDADIANFMPFRKRLADIAAEREWDGT